MYDPKDFDTLGITQDLHESLFWYAFSCQRQTCPDGEEAFFDALQRLAGGRGNEELELKVQSYDSMRTARPQAPDEDEELRRATEMSLRDAHTVPGQEQSLKEAYAYFGFQQPPETDEVLLGKFRNLCDSAPLQKSSHRQKLLTIGTATRNNHLAHQAQENMGLEEALAYVGVTKETEPDTMVEIARWQMAVSCTQLFQDMLSLEANQMR